MSNTHVLPNVAAEVQAQLGDLLAPAILSSTMTTPGSGLTLPAFSTYGYVRNGTPTRLVYVNQPAAPVTLAGGDGKYWVALMHDTHTAVASWTRQPGTHYAWQASGTQPADPPGGLVLAGVTVASGNVTAIDLSVNFPNGKVAFGTGGNLLGFDSAFTYNVGVKQVSAYNYIAPDHAGDNRISFYSTLNAAGGTNRWAFYGAGTAPSNFNGEVSVQAALRWGSWAAGIQLRLGDLVPPGYTLDVNGDAMVRAHTGLGVPPAPGQYNLNCGSANFASVRTTTLYAASNAHFAGIVGINMAPSGGYWLEVNGGARIIGTLSLDSHLNVGGNVQVTGNVYANIGAFGIGPQPGFYLSAGNLYVSATTQLVGAAQCFNTLAVHRTPQSGYWFTATNAYLDQLVVGGTTQLIGNSITNGTFAVGRAPEAGYWLTAAGTYLDTLRVGGNTLSYSFTAAENGYKPGGGPWADSSYRHMKRHIEPIPDALGLLLTQQGRVYEWEEPTRAALFPGPRYGFIEDEVTLPQWRVPREDGTVAIAANGSEALMIEALRQIVQRLETLEERVCAR